MNQSFSKTAATKIAKACEGRLSRKADLSKYTTYGTAGTAALFLKAESVDDVVKSVSICRQSDVPYYVIGKGSNILISSSGYNGLVIQLNSEFKNLKIEGSKITCGAAVPLAKVSSAALRYHLSGLEFASGIPGTIGGAIAGNAGAFNKSICDYVSKVTVYSEAGIKPYEQNIIRSSTYRKSFLPPGEVILEAVISLKKGNHEKIKAQVDAYEKERRKKQPKGLSGGSVFKNPPKVSAAMLIDEAGWKGKTLGGAMVSDKHANFIVNTGKATSYDIYNLIKIIQSDINYKYKIKLEPEVRFLGFEAEEQPGI